MVLDTVEFGLVLVCHGFEHALVLRQALFNLGNDLTLLTRLCLDLPLQRILKSFKQGIIRGRLYLSLVFESSLKVDFCFLCLLQGIYLFI